MPCICQFRTQSRLCHALTSDTSLMCLQRRKLWVRAVFDIDHRICPVHFEKCSVPKISDSLCLFFSDILVKAQEGKQQRGEHTNYKSERDAAQLNCLFRNHQESFQPPQKTYLVHLNTIHFIAYLFLPEDQMLKEGYPAYTTSCAWLGYSDQQLKQVSVL